MWPTAPKFPFVGKLNQCTKNTGMFGLEDGSLCVLLNFVNVLFPLIRPWICKLHFCNL